MATRGPKFDTYPGTVIGKVQSVLRSQEFLDLFPSAREPETRMYAGEFFDEDKVKSLARDVTQHPVLLIDYDDLFPNENTNSPTYTAGLHKLSVYACASNRFEESGQMLHALEVAARVRRALVGEEFEAQEKEHSNGHFRDEGIHRQYHSPSLSVYSFDTGLFLTEQNTAR